MGKLEEARDFLFEKLSKRIYPSVVVRLTEAESIEEIRKMVAKGDFWPGMARLEEAELEKLINILRIKRKNEKEGPLTIKREKNKLIVEDNPEMFVNVENTRHSTMKVKEGNIVQCMGIKILEGCIESIDMSESIEIARRVRAKEIATSMVTMRGKSTAKWVFGSLVDMMDESVIELARNSKIWIKDQSVLEYSEASWISINGGKRVVLGKGTTGRVNDQVSTEIVVGEGSTLKVPNFFDHKNVKIQGGRVEIIK